MSIKGQGKNSILYFQNPIPEIQNYGSQKFEHDFRMLLRTGDQVNINHQDRHE